MTCNSCALTVNKGLEKLKMEGVNANFATGEVSFNNTPNLSMPDIKKAITNLGYTVIEEHKEETGLSPVEKKFWFTLVFTVPLFLHMFVPRDFFLNNPWVQLGICLPVFIVGFLHFGKSALSVFKTGVTHMDVLIFIGINSAFWYSLTGILMYQGTHEIHNYLFFETAATITTLVLLGNVIEHRSVRQTTTALKELTQLQKTTARVVVQVNGTEQLVEKESRELVVGDVVQVNSGDRVPMDGELISGQVEVDESMISGESIPVPHTTGTEVIGGTLIVVGSMRMRVIRTGGDTVLSQIITLVKQAQQDKPDIQKLGDRVSAIFVPSVLGIAALTFLLSFFVFGIEGREAMMNSIAVLVISCPCAMGLATPTAVIAGIGRAAKVGILIKGGRTLEEMTEVKTVVFDKTGTVTTGDFITSKMEFEPALDATEQEELVSIIHGLEQNSSHPIARSIVQYLGNRARPLTLENVQEHPGEGLEGHYQGHHYQIMRGSHASTVELKKDGTPLVTLWITDQIKEGTAQMIAQLKSMGITPVMLSGDNREKTASVAQELGITEYEGEQKPLDKLKKIAALAQQQPTAMIGDGINDAPALAKAQVGISMGNATQVAIQSAQVILLNEKSLDKIPEAFLISKHTVKTIKQNLFWALFYNVVAIPIAALGFLNPMVAALAMAFSDVVVIGNSIRLKTKKLR